MPDREARHEQLQETRHRRNAGRDRAARARHENKAAEENETSIPDTRTAGEGQVNEERANAPPMGALDAEGHRPVLERSRKVR